MKSLFRSRLFLLLRDFKANLFLIALSIFIFTSLSFLNLRGSLHPLDGAVLNAIYNWKNEWGGTPKYNEFMRDITSLGGTAFVVLITAIVVCYLVLDEKKEKAVFLSLTVLTSSIVCGMLKSIFDLPRPDVFPHEMLVNSSTFPSGHTFTGSVAYLTIAFLISQFQVKSSVKFFVFSIAVLISFLIGISRMSLGVHWPSDVMAGWVLALGWCSLCWMIWPVYGSGRGQYCAGKHPT